MLWLHVNARELKRRLGAGIPPSCLSARARLLLLLACGLQSSAFILLRADTHYVDINCATSTPPYTNWDTAATNIQIAVDAADSGDTIQVGRGVYAVQSAIRMSRCLTVTGVHGPHETLVEGNGQDPCFDLSSFPAAVVEGFTITGGGRSGITCPAPGWGIVRDCIITGNTARLGGGTYMVSVQGCYIAENSASEAGGGSFYGTVQNSTIVNNSALTGGGVFRATVRNSIVYHNTALDTEDNYSLSAFSYSCTTPDPGGTGNLMAEPGIVSLGNPHLVTSSSCINAGTNTYAPVGTDIDGEPRIFDGKIDIGCDEFVSDGLTNSVLSLVPRSIPRCGVVRKRCKRSGGTMDKTPLNGTAGAPTAAMGFEWPAWLDQM